MMRAKKVVWLILLGWLILLIGLPLVIPIHEGGIDPTQLAGPAGAFLRLQGIQVYYEEQGPPTGPTILLIHGLYGSTASWRYNVPALTAAGYRVIAFDRPGFGLSDKVAAFDYGLQNQVDLTAELLDTLGVTETAVLAHSAGAKVAATLARQQPQRVTQLILADPQTTVGGPPAFVSSLIQLPPVWRWGRIGLQAYFTREKLQTSLGSFYVDPSFLGPADYDAYWRAFQTPGWDVGLLALTRDSAGDLLTEAEVSQITTETLLLWGEADSITPLSLADTLERLLPHSTLVVIPYSGHQPFEEQAVAFNTAVLSFLRP